MNSVHFVAAALCAAGGVAFAQNAPITLSDGNSSATFGGGTGYGQFSWMADGVSHLANQTFVVDFGQEIYDINDVDPAFVGTTNTNLDSGIDTLFARYQVNSIQVETLYSLRGGDSGTGASDLTELVTLTNTGGSAQSFTFYQFVDLDLAGTQDDGAAFILGNNTAVQEDVVAGLAFVATVVTPRATLVQAGEASDVAARVFSGADLNDNAFANGPANLAWALQWEFTLAAGESIIIAADKRLVSIPTPASAALLALGGIIATRRRR